MLDATTKALIETIGDAGFEITLGADKGQHLLGAVDERSGERFVVRGDDLHRVAVELAQQVGIELEDG